jgi:uncharacterized membrane protein YgcG
MSKSMDRRLKRRAKAQKWLKRHEAKRLELGKASSAKDSGGTDGATSAASAASETGRNVGTNGTAQIAPGCSGSDLLELFNQLNRGVDSAPVRSCVDTIIAKAFGGSGDAGVDVRILVDLFVLTFQTRDCRGGKGERKLFRVLLLALYEHFPLAVIGALPLIVEYGYFKDFQGLYEDVMVSPEPARFAGLAAAVVDVVVKYLRQDRDILEAAERDMTQPTGLSLAGKYVPRINEPKRKPNPEPTAKANPEPKRKPKRPQLCRASEASSAALIAGLASSAAPTTTARGLQLDFARAVRDQLFTDPLTGARPADASRQYRKLLSRLNEQLRTVERLMCTQRWDEIEVKCIPSQCLKRNRDAFLFEDKSGNIRDPTNDVRVALRQRLLDPKAAVNIKGGQLHAHQIVHQCMKGVSEGAAKVLEAQWQSIVRTVQRDIDEFAQQQQAAASSSASSTAGGGGGAGGVAAGGGGGAAGGGGGAAAADASTKKSKPTFSLGQLVALVDVSLSMAGTPMQVAVALGLLVSQLATPLFRGRVLTFESTPRWHQVEGADVVAKVKNLLRAPWGTSTNFAAAMALILKAVEDLAMRTKQMPVVPDLIVFSDMQFDAANEGGVWDTAHETICRNFADLGQRLRAAGVAGLSADDGPLQPPVITFWNLKEETTGMVARADTKGVRLLSGFSQSLLKLVLAGVLPEASDADANLDAVDPLSTLRAALDDQRYDAVRVYLAGWTDAPFAEYEFKPPVKTVKEGKEGAAGVGGGGK